MYIISVMKGFGRLGVWFVTYFIITVAFLDTMAQLPILAPFIASLGASGAYAGLILGSYSFFNMVGNLAAGPAIDRYGRRAGIVAGMLIAGIAVASYAIAARPGHLLGFRILHGLGGAILIPAVFAYAGDATRSGTIGRSMGFAGAAVAVAALVGPALGGIGRVMFGPRPVFVALGVLLILTAFVALVSVRDTAARRRTGDEPVAGGDAVIVRGPRGVRFFASVLRDPSLQYAYLSVFSLTFATGALAMVFPMTIEAAGLSAAHTGSYFGIYAIAAILVFVLPTNRLSDAFGRRPAIVAGSVLVVAALGLLTVAGGRPAFTVAMVLYGFGYGTMFPALCATVVDRTTVDRRGTAFGVFYAVFSLGTFVGPVVAGAVAQTVVSPYWAAVGVFIVVRGVLSARHFTAQPSAEAHAES